jgi:hypothetical protein
VPLSPEEAVAAFRRLGCQVIRGRGKGSHTWLQLSVDGRQRAIFNVPMNRNPIPTGTLKKSLLNQNGIRDEEHLRELLDARDPAQAFLRVVPEGGPRYRLRP